MEMTVPVLLPTRIRFPDLKGRCTTNRMPDITLVATWRERGERRWIFSGHIGGGGGVIVVVVVMLSVKQVVGGWDVPL